MSDGPPEKKIHLFDIVFLTVGLVSLPLIADSLFRAFYLARRLFTKSVQPSALTPHQSSIINYQSPVSSLSLPPLAVVIAAHDETDVIGATVACVRRSDYPAFQVFVIADNCSDGTAQTARAAGAEVWERTEQEPRGKAAALAWFIRQAEQTLKEYAALVILDADSQIAPDCLSQLAQALSQATVAQGFIQPIHADGATVASLAAYSEILSQVVDDTARAGLGWSVPLRGTGMAVPPALMAALSSQLRTRVEDSELTLLLAQQGYTIAFAPHAIIGDPKPTNASLASRQRARWLQGRTELARDYGTLMLRLLTNGRPSDAGLVLTLALRPKTLVLGIKLALGVGLLAAPVGYVIGRPLDYKSSGSDSLAPDGYAIRRAGPTLLGGSLLVAAGLDLLYYLVGLRFVDQPAVYARVLLRAPLYGWMWLRGLWTAITSREAWLSVRQRRSDAGRPSSDIGDKP